MAWQGIVGHDDVVEQFRRRAAAGRVAGTFLFVGPPGVGKRTFALRWAKALLCQTPRSELLEPCGTCEDCLLCAAGNHPDLLLVSKPPDKSDLPLQLLIGPAERRMREGLCHDIGLKPFRGGRRIAVIDDADHLNEEGANCLLKTLEEPPPNSVMILIGTSPARQLPTIRSRSQIVRFQPLPADVLADLLLREGIVDDAERAERVATLAGGSLERARFLADPAFAEFRGGLHARLAAEGWPAATIAKLLLAFADEAGKEAAARRERLRWGLGFVVEFMEQAARVAVGGPAAADVELQQAAERFLRATSAEVEVPADVVDRGLEALEHVDRNIHPTTLVEAFCDDVGRLLTPLANA